MALTATYLNSGTGGGAATTLSVTALTAAVGDWIVVFVSADNAGTAGAGTISSVTDGRGNTYTQRINQTRTAAGVANDGVSFAVFTGQITAALTSQSVTINFSASTGSRVAQVYKVTPGAGEAIGWDTFTQASGSGTSSAVSQSVSNGYLAFGATAWEYGSNAAGDTDTTGGSWSSNQRDSTGIGASGGSLVSQYKSVTTTGTQTYNTTQTSTDYVTAIFALRNANTNVALTGQGASVSSGSVSYGLAITPTGQQPTTSAGTTTFSAAASDGQDGGFGAVSWMEVPLAGSYQSQVASTTSLTGQGSSTSTGSVSVSKFGLPAGQQATVASGTITAGKGFTLTGAQTSASAGSLTSGTSIRLSSASASAVVGSFGVSKTATATSTSATATTGTAVSSASIPVSGEISTAQTGTLTAEYGFVVALSGAYVVANTGNTAAASSPALTGVESTTSTGEMIEAPSPHLVGDTATGEAGAPIAGVSVVLSGVQFGTAAGNTKASFGDIEVNPVGQEVVVGIGQPGISVSVALSGQSVNVGTSSLPVQRGQNISGSSATTSQGAVSYRLSFAITSQPTVISQGAMSPSSSSTVGLSGLSVSSAHGSMVKSQSINVSGNAVSVARGSFNPVIAVTSTGQAVTLYNGSTLFHVWKLEDIQFGLRSVRVPIDITGALVPVEMSAVTVPVTSDRVVVPKESDEVSV